MNNHKQIFSTIYENKVWSNSDTVPLSGRGSTLKSSIKYITFLQNIINNKSNNINSILDLGCGDWTFSQHINLTDKFYLGVDCVKNQIMKNNTNYSVPNNIQFLYMDITNLSQLSILKDFDLVILKDILQHWSNEEIINVLNQLLKNNYKYILMVNDYKQKRQHRSIHNKFRFSALNSKMYPLNKYKIKTLFYYGYKEVSIIENTSIELYISK